MDGIGGGVVTNKGHWIPLKTEQYKPHEIDPYTGAIVLDWVGIGEKPVTVNGKQVYSCSECGVYMKHNPHEGKYIIVTDNTLPECPFCGVKMEV